MTTKAILEYVKNHPSGRVKVAYADIDGILRGKYISTAKFLAVAEKETTFCDVVFGWDANDVVYDNGTYTGWHSGYPDAKTRIGLTDHAFQQLTRTNMRWISFFVQKFT